MFEGLGNVEVHTRYRAMWLSPRFADFNLTVGWLENAMMTGMGKT